MACALDGKLVEYTEHATRLKRSTKELGLVLLLNDAALLAADREMVTRNAVGQGMIYL